VREGGGGKGERRRGKGREEKKSKEGRQLYGEMINDTNNNNNITLTTTTTITNTHTAFLLFSRCLPCLRVGGTGTPHWDPNCSRSCSCLL
jgi:hypothetical protein